MELRYSLIDKKTGKELNPLKYALTPHGKVVNTVTSEFVTNAEFTTIIATGFKDMNGRKILQGDLLASWNQGDIQLYEVRYEQSRVGGYSGFTCIPILSNGKPDPEAGYLPVFYGKNSVVLDNLYTMPTYHKGEALAYHQWIDKAELLFEDFFLSQLDSKAN